jgi:MFS family permease
LRYVFGHQVLRPIALAAASSAFFDNVLAAVLMLLLSRELRFSAGAIGALLTAASVGALAGAWLTGRVTRRLGTARTLRLGLVTSVFFELMIPLTGHGARVAWFVVGAAIGGAGLVAFNVVQMSFRQTVTPPHLLGRMNATMRFLIWGAMPLGALAGGVLADGIGVRGTVWIAVTGRIGALAPLLAAPAVRRCRDLPVAVAT